MFLSDSIKMSGKVKVQTFESGDLINEINFPNIVTTVGKGYIASRIANSSAAVMSHMAIGSSQSIQTLNDTFVIQETLRSSVFSIVVTASEIEYVALFAPPVGSSRSISEAGILNAASAGTLLCRTTFPPITQTTSQTIAITWVVSVG